MPPMTTGRARNYMLVFTYTDKCEFDFTLLLKQMKDLGMIPFVDSNPKQAIFMCTLRDVVNLKRHMFSIDGFYKNLNNNFIKMYVMHVSDITTIYKASF